MSKKPPYYDRVIELREKGVLLKDIAKEIGIDSKKISYQMRKFGISFKRDSYTLNELQIKSLIERYVARESVPSICEDLPCSYDTAFYILRKNGVEIRSKEDIKFYYGYTINETAFEDIQEERAAYFYGWLLTDGCLTRKSVSLELCSVDEEILLELKSYLKSSNTIRRRSRLDKRTSNTYHQSSFSFSHTPIRERLVALGLSERKSLKEKCPEALKSNRHFWRGVIEGDGHLAKDGRGLELCGGIELLEAFACFCKEIDPEARTSFSKNGKMDVVRLVGRQSSSKILSNLYDGCSVKLSRKFNTYKEQYYDR